MVIFEPFKAPKQNAKTSQGEFDETWILPFCVCVCVREKLFMLFQENTKICRHAFRIGRSRYMCWGINAHSFDIIGVYIPLTRTSAISARPLTSKPWTGGLCVQSDPTARDKFLQCTCDPGGSTGFARLRPRSSLATRKISSS